YLCGGDTVVFFARRPGAISQRSRRVLKESLQNNALFFNWNLLRDYDALWEKELSQAGDAPLPRQWKDIGLMNGNGMPRFWSWWVWNTYRNRKSQESLPRAVSF
ncbi:MAG: hypothetical protein PVF82_12880, partial [Gammaproteobacteria bacterium]